MFNIIFNVIVWVGVAFVGVAHVAARVLEYKENQKKAAKRAEFAARRAQYLS